MERGISKNQNEPTLTAADIALLKESFVTNEQFRAFENRFTATHENFEKQLTRMDEKFEKRFAEIDEKFEKRFTEADEKFEKRFTSIDKRFDAIHERIDAFENRMDGHMLAIGQTFLMHEERFECIEAKIDGMSGDIRLMHSSIKNLTASVQGFIMHVGRQEHQLKILTGRVDVLENKIA